MCSHQFPEGDEWVCFCQRWGWWVWRGYREYWAAQIIDSQWGWVLVRQHICYSNTIYWFNVELKKEAWLQR